MNSPKALLLILALAGQPALFRQDEPIIQMTTQSASGRVGRIYSSSKLNFAYSESGLSLTLGTEKRYVALDRLPVYTNDCRTDQCSSKRRTFCDACIKFFEWVAWDERRQRVYFAIGTDTSQNKPWILAGYDFKSDKITRFGEFYGGGAGDAVISPSGRYLAMKGSGVCGGCCTSVYVMVADLAEHRIGTERRGNTPDKVREVVRVDKIHWASENEISFDQESYGENNCRTGSLLKNESTRSVKLSDISFR